MADFKEFTPEELAACDGQEGRPACVAANGRVMDVSGSKLWKAGKHMNRHFAGKDLSADLPLAPHAADVLERCPQVGVMVQAGPKAKDEPDLPWLLKRHPLLRRHPHPMTVHFPIAFALAPLGCLIFYCLTGAGFLAVAVPALNFLGLLATPVAMATGLATWRYNYGQAPIKPVIIKLVLSPVLWGLFALGFWWWLRQPEAVVTVAFAGLTCLQAGLAAVVGWYGAGLTFPMEKPTA